MVPEVCAPDVVTWEVLSVKIVKVAALGLAAVTSFGLVAACGSGTATSDASASASASTAVSSAPSSGSDRFKQGATNLKGAPYKFNFTSSSTANAYAGSVDPLAGLTIAKVTIVYQGVTVSADAQLSQNDYYAKINGLQLLGVDASK